MGRAALCSSAGGRRGSSQVQPAEAARRPGSHGAAARGRRWRRGSRWRCSRRCRRCRTSRPARSRCWVTRRLFSRARACRCSREAGVALATSETVRRALPVATVAVVGAAGDDGLGDRAGAVARVVREEHVMSWLRARVWQWRARRCVAARLASAGAAREARGRLARGRQAGDARRHGARRAPRRCASSPTPRGGAWSCTRRRAIRSRSTSSRRPPPRCSTCCSTTATTS